MKAQFLVLNTIALALLGNALVGQEGAIASTFSIQQANAQLIAQTSNARLTGGPWKGRWDGHDGYLFDFTMQLSADSNNRVTGNIQWTMLASPHSSHRAKIGLTAIEYVSGTYSPETRSAELEGRSKDDPNGVISLDGYKISFNSDMSGITGKSRNNGGWKGEMVGVANVSSLIALAAGVQEGAIASDYTAATTQKISRLTSLPVLLPSEASFQQLLQSGDTNYVTVKSSSNYDYKVNFGNFPDCDANACLKFSISASWGKEIDASKPNTRDSAYEFIQLFDGTKALATKGCGASCWGRVQWKYKGALYQIWGKARDYDVIIAIANSAVKAGDRSKPSVKSADNRSTQVDGQTGAVNLGGSSYFSWGLLKPESRDNSQPQIVMGYACQTQNQLQGISKRASATRYVIKRGRGTDDWWLESLGGIAVIPTDSGYVPKKISGTSGNDLKQYVTDSSSGWLKRDMDVDGLGNACLNGGIQSALKYIQDSVSNEPIAQPTTPLQPIAAASTYAYPSPAEFTQFKKTLKPSPVTLSTTDRKLRQDFQAEWQKKNRAIAPYIGAWKTADNQDVYVFPSTVSQRACVVRQKDGQLEMKLAVSMTADMRFDGNTGMFKVDPMTDVVAGRSDKSEPLSALYGAIGSPEVSASVREELGQAGCVSELPRGGAIAAKEPIVAKKPILNIPDSPKPTNSGINPMSITLNSGASSSINPTNSSTQTGEVTQLTNKGTLILAANNKQGVQYTNPLSKAIQLTIRTSPKKSWTFDPSKIDWHDANGYIYDDLTDQQFLLPNIRRGALIVKRNNIAGPYEYVGTSARIILNPGEIVTFVMNESTYGTEDYTDNIGEVEISYEISESWKVVNPGLSIIPIKKGAFSDEQWDAIQIAVDNWNRIISQDKDFSGQLRIVFTVDDTQIAFGSKGKPWKNSKNRKIFAEVFDVDEAIGKRNNYDYPDDVDLDSQDYHNRIGFNKAWLGGGKSFLGIDGCLGGVNFNSELQYPTKKFMIVLTMHELGHILGLSHPDVEPDPNANDSLMQSGCMKTGEKNITEHLIWKLEKQGYKVDRTAIKNLRWE
jgi:hypothetical protein